MQTPALSVQTSALFVRKRWIPRGQVSALRCARAGHCPAMAIHGHGQPHRHNAQEAVRDGAHVARPPATTHVDNPRQQPLRNPNGHVPHVRTASTPLRPVVARHPSAPPRPPRRTKRHPPTPANMPMRAASMLLARPTSLLRGPHRARLDPRRHGGHLAASRPVPSVPHHHAANGAGPGTDAVPGSSQT